MQNRGKMGHGDHLTGNTGSIDNYGGIWIFKGLGMLLQGAEQCKLIGMALIASEICRILKITNFLLRQPLLKA